MADVKINIVVTRERFDEVFSIEDWLNFNNLNNFDFYNYMLKFVADENSEPCTEAQARALFRKIPAKEWPQYVEQFSRTVRDAFVNPTSGSSSGSSSLPENDLPPSG